ncbi:MAG: TetR family transcriptional regulator [Pseudomonadales bacterium]|nr:TetR family transcriptional regulator [Pseudomonadales bacterium]
MAQSETVENILDTAERLFAEKGFGETSLRMITAKAGVNLAAVNYHFGSKESLIQAVFARFLNPFTARVLEVLDEKEKTWSEDPEAEAPELEELLRLVVYTAAEINDYDVRKSATFLRLLGLAYTQAQSHLRTYINNEYGVVFQRIVAIMQQLCPNHSPQDFYWATHFALGATIFTMSGIDALIAMYEEDFDKSIVVHEVVERLVPFLAAGIRGVTK